ncbi:hypothetical protein ACFE04_018588 [Oxalis oulophora]
MDHYYITNKDFSLNQLGLYEVEEEDDDDVFYAELRKRVLLLMEEEEEECLSVRKPAKRYSSCALEPGSYFDWRWGYETSSVNETVPTWLVNLWRRNNSGNGTGVFIPHIVKSRRRQNKSGNRNNQRRRIHKRADEN